MVYRPSSIVHQTRHRPAWVALLMTQWGDGARAGKLRLIFWKRCLSHRLTVESPVIGLFSRARPSVVGWHENSLPFTCFSGASLCTWTLTVKMQVDRNRSIHRHQSGAPKAWSPTLKKRACNRIAISVGCSSASGMGILPMCSHNIHAAT